MIKVGNVLKRKASNVHYVVTLVNTRDGVIETLGYDGSVSCAYPNELDKFEVYDSILDVLPVPVAPESHLDTQHGGDHYKKLGDYQPWQVLKAWLTPEEFRGYMKGTAIAYLAREAEKGGDLDIKKATHTLQAFIEMEVGE
jgi:hypothetical protein